MEQEPPVQRFHLSSNFNKVFGLVVAVGLVLGLGTGYVLASKNNGGGIVSPVDLTNSQPKSAAQDNRTFRDFAEGKITKKPAPKNPNDYSAEGTHLLIREKGVPVALTSSVVDLAEYEGKTVKVFGETQKAIKEGWLMDIGKVEVLQ